MSETILIVEDEARLARLLADYLRASGFATHCLGDGREVLDWVRAHDPALILLDLMLPGRDGLALCRDLRAFSEVPIIMTTARVEEIDRLLGLELGADDYVCKPYSPREVVARVKAVLRRRRPPATRPEPGLLRLDPETLRVQAPDGRSGRADRRGVRPAPDPARGPRAHLPPRPSHGPHLPRRAHRLRPHHRQPHQEAQTQARRTAARTGS